MLVRSFKWCSLLKKGKKFKKKKLELAMNMAFIKIDSISELIETGTNNYPDKANEILLMMI